MAGVFEVNGSELSWNRAAQIPFGRKTCGLFLAAMFVGDSFRDKCRADIITLMDPWKIRSENDLGETLVIVHTDKGLNLLNNILSVKVRTESI